MITNILISDCSEVLRISMATSYVALANAELADSDSVSTTGYIPHIVMDENGVINVEHLMPFGIPLMDALLIDPYQPEVDIAQTSNEEFEIPEPDVEEVYSAAEELVNLSVDFTHNTESPPGGEPLVE